MKNLTTLTLFVWMVFPMAFAYNAEHVQLFQQTKTCEGCDLNLLNATPHSLGQFDFTSSVLSGSYFYGSSFSELNLSQLQAREINAVGLMFHNNNLTDADFSYSDISFLKVTYWNRGDYIKFTGSFLKGSDFSYTEFYAPNFASAYMKNACLYQAKWPQANLSEAVLQSADLSFAQFINADLQGADLTGATTSHTDFTGANLLNAKISADQLKRARSVCGATLPDGSAGACPP